MVGTVGWYNKDVCLQRSERSVVMLQSVTTPNDMAVLTVCDWLTMSGNRMALYVMHVPCMLLQARS